MEISMPVPLLITSLHAHEYIITGLYVKMIISILGIFMTFELYGMFFPSLRCQSTVRPTSEVQQTDPLVILLLAGNPGSSSVELSGIGHQNTNSKKSGSLPGSKPNSNLLKCLCQILISHI